MRFIEPEDMVDYLVRLCTSYPDEVRTEEEGEEIGVEVVLQDGSCLRSGIIGEYPADLDLRTMGPALFNRLVVGVALRRMRLPRGEVRHED